MNEGAELFVCPGGEGTGETTRRSVGIRLLPQSLLDPETLLAFLRHELFHIGDMLAPAFGYEPRLPRAALGPAHEGLVQDRYRVLWDTYIDGRLAGQGRAPASIREARLREFLRTFGMLGGQAVEAFARFFSSGPLTHSALVAFATAPLAAVDAPSGALAPSPVAARSLASGSRCPLCGFPTRAFETHPDQLPPAVVDRIRVSFPTWTPSCGLCQQCADLYSSGASRAPGPLVR
ncbi:MAG: hypothetical protein HY712_05360 [candidate division NC10 bacterium]|nr:hypothetical protein [candidate division NC10 bacterium]